MVMTSSGMGDVAEERLTVLWLRIEDAHYSYLEAEESPEKLQQKKKLEGYIKEYLTLVPHELKFSITQTSKVFQRSINELADYSAYRAGIGWAALARYAGNLLMQPWRKEYKVIRLYSGFYKHEVEANLVGAEELLHAMGYRALGGGRLALDAPLCPDMVAAVSRDALFAHCECQIMCQIWEQAWSSGSRVSWAEVARERTRAVGSASLTNITNMTNMNNMTNMTNVANITNVGNMTHMTHMNNIANLPTHGYAHESEIYSNVAVTPETHRSRLVDTRYHNNVTSQCNHLCPDKMEEPITPMMHPYMMPANVMPQMMYPIPPDIPVTVPQCNPIPSVMTPYGPVPYYYPVQAPYMIPTPVYAPIKQATTVPVNGYPAPQYRYPTVPTAQLIELDSSTVYENGKFERHDPERHRKSRQTDSSKRNSTSKSAFSDVSLPSLPRSDTQPALSKAKEDGMGTYESWDYVFRNLSSKNQEGDSRSGFSQSLDRDSRTLDRLDREERRSKYQPTTLDLEDGLQALSLDRSYDEEMYRTAKVNENLMRRQELKKARQVVRKIDDKKPKSRELVGNPKADGLVPNKVAPDKVKLLTKKEIKDRKDVIKQQGSVNGSLSNTAEVKKVKKPTRLVAVEVDKPSKSKPVENGVHKTAHTSRSTGNTQPDYDIKAQLVVTLDETDSVRRPKITERERSSSRTSQHERERDEVEIKRDKWQCGTCTYLNKGSLVACEMCGKSKRGPEIEPLTSGGRECPACTLVNKREARVCDACGTSLDHCPTYI